MLRYLFFGTLYRLFFHIRPTNKFYIVRLSLRLNDRCSVFNARSSKVVFLHVWLCGTTSPAALIFRTFASLLVTPNDKKKRILKQEGGNEFNLFMVVVLFRSRWNGSAEFMFVFRYSAFVTDINEVDHLSLFYHTTNLSFKIFPKLFQQKWKCNLPGGFIAGLRF